MDAVGTILMSLAARARPHVDIATLLCEEAADTLPVAGSSLVVMTPEGSRAPVAAIGRYAKRLEEIQFVTGEGPSVDAFTKGRLVLAGDLATRPGWPVFSPAALDAGVAAVFAFPVQIGGIRLGVFELHHTEPGSLGEQDLSSCLHFADTAALVLMHGEDVGPWAKDEMDDWTAYGVQAEVHQATGMVSVQASVDLNEALSMLRARAFADARPALEVAQDVTARRLRFDPPMPDGEVAR